MSETNTFSKEINEEIWMESLADGVLSDVEWEFDAKAREKTRTRQLWLDEHRSLSVSQTQQNMLRPHDILNRVELLSDYRKHEMPEIGFVTWNTESMELRYPFAPLEIDIESLLLEAISKAMGKSG